MKVFDYIQDKVLILDGAFGTMVQQRVEKIGEIPEILSITKPEIISEIYKLYVDAGSQVIYANTFGANKYKLEHTDYSVKEVISASVQLAKKATNGTSTLVALDIGPIGQLVEPSGTLTFEETYDLFKEMVEVGVENGVDLIVIETMSDLYEVKAAVLACKENCNLPVFVTMTLDETKRTFLGNTVVEIVAVLEGLDVDAIGLNCSLGPKELLPIVEELCSLSTKPIIVKPNAGLPNPIDNSYDISSDEFVDYIEKMYLCGVSIVGGCCGTNEVFIKKISDKFKNKDRIKREVKKQSLVCSGSKTVFIDEVRVIGERINPTGKKVLKEAIKNKNYEYILSLAFEQIDAGAEILDVNIGLPDINEKDFMVSIIKKIQSVTNTPLQIDSSDHEVLEAGLRVYNGKAIVNSVNGEDEVLDRVLPVVKKYGAAVLGLALDSNGIPKKAEDRVKIAKKILDKAISYGINKEDVFIDCLTLTVSAQQEEAAETLKALRMIREDLGLKTILGVSNISFGLPERELINKTFLALAMVSGLDMPIMNPNNKAMMDCIDAFKVLNFNDISSEKYIAKHSKAAVEEKQLSSEDITIEYAILRGLKDESRKLTEHLLTFETELNVVDNYLIKALDVVGKKFETGELFLPQLLQSAQAAQAAFDVVKTKIIASGKTAEPKGKVLLATVQGDIHDIGKNIVKVILQNYGYDIVDLGKDVPIKEVVAVVKEQNIKLVGLSALMTTTLKNMNLTIKALKEAQLDCKIMVGGAVLTEEYAKMINADFYSKDAQGAIEIARKVFV